MHVNLSQFSRRWKKASSFSFSPFLVASNKNLISELSASTHWSLCLSLPSRKTIEGKEKDKRDSQSVIQESDMRQKLAIQKYRLIYPLWFSFPVISLTSDKKEQGKWQMESCLVSGLSRGANHRMTDSYHLSLIHLEWERQQWKDNKGEEKIKSEYWLVLHYDWRKNSQLLVDRVVDSLCGEGRTQVKKQDGQTKERKEVLLGMMRGKKSMWHKNL